MPIRGKTTVTLTLRELGVLRQWLDEGRTQTTEMYGWDDETQSFKVDDDDETLAEINRIDDKLGRAVQRCYQGVTP